MTTPEQRWDGPIQEAIREWDEALGHRPKPGSHAVTFFAPPTRPNGGTVYLRPSDAPTGLRVLDACCRKGGSSYGYKLAGFYVVGVDEEDHKDGYAGDEFIQGDALEYILEHGHEFDLIHGGPPCQADCNLMAGTNAGMDHGHVSLLARMRDCLEWVGKPYVIEQPVGKAVMRKDVMLCGLHFGLKVFRHRQFELGGWSMPNLPHNQKELHAGHRVAGYRHGVNYEGDMFAPYGDGGGKGSVADWQQAMGIDWMSNKKDLAAAIPPAYTAHIGRHFAAQASSLSVA